MTRCDLSDLPVDQCACRIHGPQETPAARTGVVVARTDARYPGYCVVCERAFREGAPLALVDGDWIHDRCAESA